MAWVPTADREYTIGVRPVATHRITTSTVELTHLTIATIVLTADLALITRSLRSVVNFGLLDLSGLALFLPLGLAAALSGFVAHEMAHKVVAQRYGFWAEFRMSPFGLIFSFMTALFGFLFAAPGATIVGGMGDVREWGKTSVAGPLLNLSEGAAFLAGGEGAQAAHLAPALSGALLLLAFFNGWFAAFNLIPWGPLDGRKVWRWDHRIWVATFAISLAFAGLLFWITQVNALSL